MKYCLIIWGFLFLLSACKSPNAPTKYIYQTKSTSLPYTDAKKDKASATKEAEEKLAYYAKDFCRSMGYGWALNKVENRGELYCEETPEGHQCRKKNVVFDCRRRDDK